MAKPGLADLEAFALVARQRSFRGAARQGGVSASALSEAVRRLENDLGLRLLNRTTRSVTPTAAGSQLLARLTPAFSEVASAVEAVNSFRDSPQGLLRLNVPTIVARLVLPGIVPAFLKAHPGIRLEVTTEDSFIDVLAAGFDAGIRYDESLARDMIAVPIGPRRQRYALAAAPSYLAGREAPQHPKHLLQHACIRHRFASGSILPWEFERKGRLLRINADGPLMASNMDLELAAALAGQGFIYTFEDLLLPHFQSGALQPLLPDWWQSFSGPYLYYAGRSHIPAPLQAFISYLRKQRRAA